MVALLVGWMARTEAVLTDEQLGNKMADNSVVEKAAETAAATAAEMDDPSAGSSAV